jgi:hypothetical protein
LTASPPLPVSVGGCNFGNVRSFGTIGSIRAASRASASHCPLAAQAAPTTTGYAVYADGDIKFDTVGYLEAK